MAKHPEMEGFNRTVWSIVRQVPHGKVTTYGQIASMIPAPTEVEPEDYEKLSPRWVGQAMNAVSAADSGNIPWWRVINAKGGISLASETRAGQQQRIRLKREGVAFNEKEEVDFAIVGWDGPGEDWLQEHKLLAPRPLITPPDESNPTQLKLF
jgi:methylated-DNA-protein-cysteine methyltransferase related protein